MNITHFPSSCRCKNENPLCSAICAKITAAKKGVIVANVGTPDEPTPPALYRYLKEFLSDSRVIETKGLWGKLVWFFVLRFFILPFRPKRSAALYKRLWTTDGSPLLFHTKRVVAKLKSVLPTEYEVEVGMRYGSPSIDSAIDKLIEKGCTELTVIPMYPQYAGATYGTTCDAVFDKLKKVRWIPTLRFTPPFFNDARYLKLLADDINQQLTALSFKPEILIISNHGIPADYIKQGDPYCCQSIDLFNALKPLINFDQSKISPTFQSRFGKQVWLQPYADEYVAEIAKAGIKSIASFCPGFTTDCLETIDEIGHELKETFIENGGENFAFLPCLNDKAEFVEFLARMVKGV